MVRRPLWHISRVTPLHGDAREVGTAMPTGSISGIAARQRAWQAFLVETDADFCRLSRAGLLSAAVAGHRKGGCR